MHALGIDIGGTGMKAAPVDLETGKFVADRVKIATPHPAVPEAVAEVVQKLVATFSWTGPIGCTFPGVVMNGVTRTAANLDPAWIGLDGRELLCKAVGQDIRLINDADAAGVAEMTFGAGKSESGTVFMVTFGTGIAARCSWTASWCRTPSSGTSRSAARTRRSGPPSGPRARTT